MLISLRSVRLTSWWESYQNLNFWTVYRLIEKLSMAQVLRNQHIHLVRMNSKVNLMFKCISIAHLRKSLRSQKRQMRTLQTTITITTKVQDKNKTKLIQIFHIKNSQMLKLCLANTLTQMSLKPSLFALITSAIYGADSLTTTILN